MSYTFKVIPELVWAVVLAVLAYLAEALSGLKLADWQAWLPIIAAGAGRAVLAAIVAFFTKTGTFQAR